MKGTSVSVRLQIFPFAFKIPNNTITFGDNGKGKVKGLDKIAISNDLSISNVLLVECLNFNLLSVAQLCDLGFKCIFGVDDVEIISVDGSNLIFKGFRYENLYLV